MIAEVLKLDINKLPIKLEIFENGKLKNIYFIKSNKEKSSVFLNKPEFVK